jgi:hypothetical protein
MRSDLNTPPEVSVIIVTHNSARCLGACLAALRQQGVAIQLIIVDNASLPTEAPTLDDNESGELILNTRNKGFAPAVNQGLERARAPYVLLLNPDVYLEFGALRLLLRFLEANPQRAAASPRMWWDVAHTALLPLTAVPSLAPLVARVIAGRLQIARTLLGRWWIASRKRLWFAQEPFAVPAIVGGCVLIAKSVLDRVGPLDSRFPFYYEEVEWSLRARRHGYQLFVVPAAEAVHAFGHSRKGSRRVERWAAVSGRRYWRMRYGKPGARLAAGLLAQTVKPRFTAIEDLGEHTEPPTLTWRETAQPQVLEVAFDPLFGSTAAIFPGGGEFRFPEALWSEMPPETYHARLLCGSELHPSHYWRWRRITVS